MNDILAYGLDIVRFIQQFRSPLLDTFFRTVTLLGEEEFYLLALPLIYWCGDSRGGIRVTYFVLLSHYFNMCLKDIWHQPRPFNFQPSLKLSGAEGFGLPSNHAQTGLVFWYSLAAIMQSKWLKIAGIAAVILGAFSRLYLGVHFPTDIIGGWAVGAILLALFAYTEPALTATANSFRPGMQAVLAILLPLVLLASHPGKETTAILASLSGALFGLVCQKRYFAAEDLVPHGEWRKLLVRTVVGAAMVVVVSAGLKAIFPQEGAAYYLLFRYIRYWLIGIIITLLGPWLFILLNLGPEPETAKYRAIGYIRIRK